MAVYIQHNCHQKWLILLCIHTALSVCLSVPLLKLIIFLFPMTRLCWYTVETSLQECCDKGPTLGRDQHFVHWISDIITYYNLTSAERWLFHKAGSGPTRQVPLCIHKYKPNKMRCFLLPPLVEACHTHVSIKVIWNCGVVNILMGYFFLVKAVNLSTHITCLHPP